MGNYEPRHARRRLNDELNDLAFEKGRTSPDRRIVSYSTAFSLDTTKQRPLLDQAEKMWDEEVQQAMNGEQKVLIETKAIMLHEIFHERWQDIWIHHL